MITSKKFHLVFIIAILILCIGLIGVLYLNVSEKENHHYNSFLRKILSESVHLSGELDIKYNSYYISGVTTSNIYFGNFTAPWHLLVSNTLLTDTQHVELNTIGDEDLEFRTINVSVDSPYFYFSLFSAEGSKIEDLKVVVLRFAECSRSNVEGSRIDRELFQHED